MKLFRNLSYNTFQLVVNQASGALIFYILSAGLNKTIFGQVNLALGIFMASFNILSFGMDQLVVKKIANGQSVPGVLGTYLLHVLVAGSTFYGLLIVGYMLAGQPAAYTMLLWIGAGKLLLFFSTPFKQVCSGLEKFRLLSRMLVISNTVRALGLLALMTLGNLTTTSIAIMFIAGDLLELTFSLVLYRHYLGTLSGLSTTRARYLAFMHESLPQVGVVVITSLLARFDWLFIGFYSSAAKLAEYSFAYKIYEIATLPLLAVAPLLIPRFTRHFNNPEASKMNFGMLIAAEMAVAGGTMLLLNIAWNPLIDLLTHGKYGAVNATSVFFLSLSIPFLYINNLFWTIYFVQGKLQRILYSFLIAVAVNIVSNLLLVPFIGNAGAGIACLLSTVSQGVFYRIHIRNAEIRGAFTSLITCVTGTLGILALTSLLAISPWGKALVSCLLYSMLLLISYQLRKRNFLVRFHSFF